MKKMNIALVAFGRIAKTHMLATYMANLKLDLPFELKVSHIITSRPLDVPFSDVCVCSSLSEALSTGEEIDIVDICNINEAHYDEIKTAVAAKKAIYCEKPLTDNTQKSKEIYQLVQEANLLNGVPLIFRYLPCVHMLKVKLQNKELGPIIHVDAKYYHNGYLKKEKRNTWRTSRESGGGVSIDLGIHIVDLISFILGEPNSIYNQVNKYFKDVEVDEVYEASMKYGDDSLVDITTSRIYSQEKQDIFIEVFCEKGSYRCDLTDPYTLKEHYFGGNTTYIKPTGKEEFMRYVVAEGAATSFHLDAHMGCISDFARKVFDSENGGYFADFEQAYRSQALLSCESYLGKK